MSTVISGQRGFAAGVCIGVLLNTYVFLFFNHLVVGCTVLNPEGAENSLALFSVAKVKLSGSAEKSALLTADENSSCLTRHSLAGGTGENRQAHPWAKENDPPTVSQDPRTQQVSTTMGSFGGAACLLFLSQGGQWVEVGLEEVPPPRLWR